MKLKANHEKDRTHLLVGLKNAMNLLVSNNVHKTNSVEFGDLIGEASEALVALEQFY